MGDWMRVLTVGGLVSLLVFLIVVLFYCAVVLVKANAIRLPTFVRNRIWARMRKHNSWVFDHRFDEKKTAPHVLHGTFPSADALLGPYLKRFWPDEEWTRTQHTTGSVSYVVNFSLLSDIELDTGESLKSLALAFQVEIWLYAVREDMFSICYSFPSPITNDDLLLTIGGIHLRDYIFWTAAAAVAGFETIHTLEQIRALLLVHPAHNLVLAKDMRSASQIADHLEPTLWLLECQYKTAQQILKVHQGYMQESLQKQETWNRSLGQQIKAYLDQQNEMDAAQFATQIGIFAETQARVIGEVIRQITPMPPSIPRPRGRPSESAYDKAYTQFIKTSGDLAGAVRFLVAQHNYTEEAAREAMKRRIRRERNSEDMERNSES